MNESFLDKSQLYLLAVSFGPDSMAMLDMMRASNYQIAVAHVNYHKRPASNLEQSGLEQYCLLFDIPLYVLDLKGAKAKDNCQSWARTKRYQFFSELVANIGAAGVITAHHKDDHLETILMQQNQKKMSFCMGICATTVINDTKIIRPLLQYSKNYLIEYCKNHSVPFAIDESNLQDNYERNRIRHHVVPLLKEDEINRLLNEADLQNEATIHAVNKIRQVIKEKQLPIDFINSASPRIVFLSLCELIHQHVKGFPVSQGLIKEVTQISKKDMSSWRRHLRGNYWLVRSYDQLEVIYFSGESHYAYLYSKPTRDDTPYFFMDFTSGSHRDLIQEDDYPITLRNPLPGDSILINGTPRLLRRLFIDWKLPRHRRLMWPVIVNRHGTIKFVPRYQKDFVVSSKSVFYVK
jgi:tRNA(Ile)-lysidine synthase